MTQHGPTSFNPLAATQQPLNTPLAHILADRIRRQGPISFADWMDACLYHPQHGYYRRGRPTVGRDGDFLTSPEVHPIFGAAVGHVAAELWQNLGRPPSFAITEIGPGAGALAESALRHLHATDPDLAAATHYTLVEPDADAARRQRERIQIVHTVHNIHAIDHLDDLASDSDLIVANELLDALPSHRLIYQDGHWRELLVNYSPACGFHDASSQVTDLELLDPLCDVVPAEGQIVEVAPKRAEIVTQLANALADNGLLLLFDYGYPRERLYASWRRDGTLMTFRSHVPGHDPYARPGETDITTHIDIDQIREAAVDAGLTPLTALSQAEWLHHLGAATLPAVADAADANLDANRYLAARRAVETLTDPAELGRIAVMGFTRGAVGRLPGWSAP